MPLSEGYLWVFGFLILCAHVYQPCSCAPLGRSWPSKRPQLLLLREEQAIDRWDVVILLEGVECVPVLVRLLRLVVLGRVLGFWKTLELRSSRAYFCVYVLAIATVLGGQYGFVGGSLGVPNLETTGSA